MQRGKKSMAYKAENGHLHLIKSYFIDYLSLVRAETREKRVETKKRQRDSYEQRNLKKRQEREWT